MEINEKDGVTERVSAALSFLMTENMLHYISVLETRAIGAAVMSSYLGFVIGGYLLGSILFAYVLPKLTRHIDIGRCRRTAIRDLQCVLVRWCDLWNLCAAAGTFEGIFSGVAVRADRRSAIPVVCSSNGSACAGHAYSIYHRGRGGKAIAVSFGFS